MKGVEILATQEIVISESISLWGLALGLLILFICLGSAYTLVKDKLTNAASAIPLALFGICMCAYFIMMTMVPKEYETQYKVSLSGEVNMDEFINKYEIIGQEENVYIVREHKSE